MRISDWSSDVCPSDLGMDMLHAGRAAAPIAAAGMLDDGADPDKVAALLFQALNRTNSGQLFRHDDVLVSEKLYERLIASFKAAELGRASFRERVLQYV